MPPSPRPTPPPLPRSLSHGKFLSESPTRGSHQSAGQSGRGRHRPTQSLCHSQGPWGPTRPGGAWAERGHSQAPPTFPAHFHCAWKFNSVRSHGAAQVLWTQVPRGGVFSCLGAGAGRVQGSSFARHFTAVDFELGPGRPPWPPWLLPGLQAQSVVGGAGNWGGHGRCTACLAGARVEGGPGGPGGGRKSPCVPQVLATPWASFPSSALPVGFCGSFPWCPGPQPCGSMRRQAGSRGVRDCGALAPAHSGGGTALPEPSVPTMVWSSNHPKERRGGHLVQAPGRSMWTGTCERVCRPLAVPGPPHQRSSADTQGCSQPPPCQPLGRQAAAGDAVGTGGDQAVPTAAFLKHRMNF